jgi:hypothetical protein
MAQTSRVVLNRKAFQEVSLAIADGLFAVAEEVLAVVVVPDAPPYSKGLVEGGGAIAYLGTKKVNGTTIGGGQIKKPRGVKTAGGATAIVGFGFPARFVELGTLHSRAHPFFTPAVMQVVGSNAEVIISEAVANRLAGIRNADSAAITSRIKAAKAARAAKGLPSRRVASKAPTMRSLRAALRAEAKKQGYGGG